MLTLFAGALAGALLLNSRLALAPALAAAAGLALARRLVRLVAYGDGRSRVRSGAVKRGQLLDAPHYPASSGAQAPACVLTDTTMW